MPKTLKSCNLKPPFQRQRRKGIVPYLGVFSVLILASPSVVLGSSWGASAGYNNPAGASLGVNILYLGKPFGIEFGVGGVGADSQEKSGTTGLWGDVDLKLFFADKWRPFVEAGFGMQIGLKAGEGSGAGASAGEPFLGGGVLYQGSTLYGYAAADYKWNTKKWIVPVLGLGIQF
jgi:hypothetical protein